MHSRGHNGLMQGMSRVVLVLHPGLGTYDLGVHVSTSSEMQILHDKGKVVRT